MLKNIQRHALSLKKYSLSNFEMQPKIAGINDSFSDLDNSNSNLQNENKISDLINFNLSNNNGPWGPWNNSNDKTTDNKESNKTSNSSGSPNHDDKDKDKDNKQVKEKSANANNPFSSGFNKSTNDDNNNNTNNTYKKSYNNHHNQENQDIFDRLIDKITNFILSFNQDKVKNFKNNNSNKSLIGLIALSILLLYLSLGFYKVNTDENAVVLYFGKFNKIATPGLNYYIPMPFGQVIKKSVTSVNTEEFGFSSDNRKSLKRNFDAESLMLTGDENIVDIEFQVQWQIADIKDFVFNIVEPNQAIRKSAESAMREIIARTPIADALSDGKQQIEQDAKILLQEILDSYGAGVRVILVQLRRVDPPSQVIDAFRDVQTAKADKEREINQAQAYANDIIPRARGQAAQLLEQSQAYSKEIVANSEGEAGRFSSIYNQYSKAKQVTKKRLYLETMEYIYRNMDKIYIDRSIAKSAVLPYFPVNNPINNAVNNFSDSSTKNVDNSLKSTSNIVKQ